MLEDYLKTASSENSVQPMLRLGYLYMACGNKESAKEKFRRLANLPQGMDDPAKGEAALRVAYLSTGRERGVWSEKNTGWNLCG